MKSRVPRVPSGSGTGSPPIGGTGWELVPTYSRQKGLRLFRRRTTEASFLFIAESLLRLSEVRERMSHEEIR